MNSCFMPVLLSRVNLEDLSFAIRSFFERFSQLEASLERTGLLSPPWLLEKGESEYIVVDGFKRLWWLRGKGCQEIECLVFPEECDRSQLMIRRMEGKLFGPKLNVAEKAQIIAKSTGVLSRRFVADGLLPALEIPFRPGVVERWSALAAAGEELLEAAASALISERAALELASWEWEERRDMVSLLKMLRCSAAIQTEIIERIVCVAGRQGKERVSVLRNEELQAILGDPRSNHRQKTQSVRDLLAGWAFPKLRAREERFTRDVNEASLPKAIRLMPPPAFEGERWLLQVAFSTPKDLSSHLETAMEFSRSPVLRKILTPTAVQGSANGRTRE